MLSFAFLLKFLDTKIGQILGCNIMKQSLRCEVGELPAFSQTREGMSVGCDLMVWRDVFVVSPFEEDGFSSYLWPSRRYVERRKNPNLEARVNLESSNNIPN